MFPQFKSFEALQIVKSSIVSLCIIFKSIFKDSQAFYLIETKGLQIAFAQVLRISQLYTIVNLLIEIDITVTGLGFSFRGSKVM